MTTRRLLGIFPHPDDEGTMSGALLRYGQQGVETGLVCITRGEAGEIADPALATPETLGDVREGEMRAAAAALDVQHLWFLGYRDSGMAGTADNERPDTLLQADRVEATGRIVDVLRAFRPQVVVTFDPTGGYGHPDHITTCSLTTAAFAAAADATQYPELGPAYAVSKLYYTSGLRRGVMRRMVDWLKEQGMPVQDWMTALDWDQLGLAEDQINVRLDVQEYVEAKERSWGSHRTQMNPNSPMAKLPPEVVREWRGFHEYYHLAATRVGPDVPGEHDLFARVEA